MDYLLHLLILIGIYSILGTALNLLAGYVGLVSIAHAAFYGIGAYASAIMALRVGTPFPINAVCAMLSSGAVGALVAIATLRTRDDYFVITTFTFQVLAFSLFNNWTELTGGPLGLRAIPNASILGFDVSSKERFLIVVGACLCLTLAFLWITVNSPFGRVLKAIREDEVLVSSVGKDVGYFKFAATVISAGLSGLAGCLYAYYVSFIDPTSFTVMESIFIISIVIVGGAGAFWGSLLGAALLIVVPETLRFLDTPTAISASLRQIIYGAILVCMLMLRPRGILGVFEMRERRSVNS